MTKTLTPRQAVIHNLAICLATKPDEPIGKTLFDILACRLENKTHPVFMSDSELAQAIEVWAVGEAE